ncbi:hypothetical protein [Nocardioides mangrovi]|uniref:Uncharacterized protein n=1 Tax=Nocardioides mangrovi TaxID=2874580 RepID=A0ABS7UC05_9ACTN|nr:hypothetical protein [Nocardioides mangrovi]MBZ5738520.1 hypothetical protein [Nocardioides mangrovi]
MTILPVALGVALAWCAVTLPLAVAVGRAFRDGSREAGPDQEAAAVGALLS